MVLEHRIRNLRRTHASHSKGPKAPVRWDWVEIPLGKNPGPGFKHVRLLTNQQGYAVAYALVSSTLKNPPVKGKLIERVKAHVPDLPKKSLDPKGLLNPGRVLAESHLSGAL